jgi:hypothetical protein
MRSIIVACCLLMVGVAQGQESQPTSAPTSQPVGAPVSQPTMVLATNQPASEVEPAQCEECLTPGVRRAQSYRAATILGLGGVLGAYVSFKGMGAFEQVERPMMKASIGLGVVSLTSLNASVAALGVTRYKKTGKLRPLIISTLFSSGLVLGHFTMAMAMAWSQDGVDPEPGEETDVVAAAIGTFLASSGSAFLISSGMLVKTSKEVVSSLSRWREERRATRDAALQKHESVVVR